MGESSLQNGGLQKKLSFVHVYAIATGAIFTYLGYWDTIFVSYCGPGTWLAFVLMAICVLPIAFIYCELAPLFPQTGGTLCYNTVGLNKHFGYFACSFMLLAYISVPPATIQGMVKWVLRVTGIQLSYEHTIYLCMLLLGLYCLLSLMDVQVAGNIQVFMLCCAVTCCLLGAFFFFTSGHWSIDNLKNVIQSGLLTDTPEAGNGGIKGWLVGLALIINVYFGFETVPQLIEESNFPIQKTSTAIWASVVTCGFCYSIFFLAVCGLGSYQELLYPNGQLVEFLSITAMESMGWTIWPFIFGFGAVFCAIGTCLLGFWLCGVRIFYAMGRSNYLPAVWSKCNKKQQPILGNLVFLGISWLFLLLQEQLTDFFNLQAVGVAFAYALTSISAMRIARKHPEWERPYKIPGGQATRIAALIVSVVVAFGCCIGQTRTGWICFGIFIGLDIVMWLIMRRRWKDAPVVWITPDGPTEF